MKNQINFLSEWPYPIKYGVEKRIETDVLIIGAGVAGGLAAVGAAKRGVAVAVVDKAPILISGSGGAGLDHYLGCISNPDCAYTPEEYMDLPESGRVFGDHRKYITAKNSWNALMELEKLGLKIRDEDDEFAGAPFRDEKSKLMYAYDYKNKTTVRIRGGHYFKQVMYQWLEKAENAALYERVMITNLLTEGGKSGARVIGATGFSVETGEFYIFNAKSVIISCGGISGQTWSGNLEMFANGYRMDPNCSGDGPAMAWQAGAKFCGSEQYGDPRGMAGNPFGWPWYGVGNPDNTWMPCSIVDNNGKEIPWEDAYGNPISGIEARCMPAEGQPYIIQDRPGLIHDLPERIRNGEYELPFWADLTLLPESERRGIWGLMICNEGRTRYGIYEYYNKAGFNPDKDMLQVPVMIPEHYVDKKKDWFQGEPYVTRFWKADTLSAVATDWDQMSSLEGLFVAGSDSSQGGAAACSSGMYAANRAAEYAMKVEPGKLDEAQLAAEKERVYAPVKRANDPNANISWKELWAGTARVMQQDCGDYRTIPICEHGLMWLDSIRKHEAQMTYAYNPHELWRLMECENRITVGQVYLNSCIAQLKAQKSGEDEGKVMFNQLKDEKLVTTFKEDKYWLKAPYAPTYLENYEKCTAAEREVL